MIDLTQQRRIADAVHELAILLESRQPKLVLAESCTAGLVSGLLAQVPGISRFLIGSAATYRESAKTGWLGVPVELLLKHTAVSAEVTLAMASGALATIDEADLSVAITGHLEPSASEAGCHIYICSCQRFANGQAIEQLNAVRHQPAGQSRLQRQWSAAELAIAHCRQAVQSMA